MATGAQGISRGETWVEIKNKAKGALRGLIIGKKYFVGLSGDLPHNEDHYLNIVQQIQGEMRLAEEDNGKKISASVTLKVGGKEKTIKWREVENEEDMKDKIVNGFPNINGWKIKHPEYDGQVTHEGGLPMNVGEIWYIWTEDGEEVGEWMYSTVDPDELELIRNEGVGMFLNNYNYNYN